MNLAVVLTRENVILELHVDTNTGVRTVLNMVTQSLIAGSFKITLNVEFNVGTPMETNHQMDTRTASRKVPVMGVVIGNNN